jgi:Fe-S cluster biosynthesis and repair protein YggX
MIICVGRINQYHKQEMLINEYKVEYNYFKHYHLVEEQVLMMKWQDKLSKVYLY